MCNVNATTLSFMFIQAPIVGAPALTVLPIQLILLSKLQRRVNEIFSNKDLGGLVSVQTLQRSTPRREKFVTICANTTSFGAPEGVGGGAIVDVNEPKAMRRSKPV